MTSDLPAGFILDEPVKAKQAVSDLPQGFIMDAEPTARSVAIQGSQGFNEGIANIAGLPVDATNALLNKVGIPVSKKPFGGSESIKSGLKTIGAMGDLPRNRTERITKRVGEEIGATILPTAGIIGKAGKTVNTVAKGMFAPAIEAVKQAPKTFLAAETGLSTASGVGAGVANEVAPGSLTAEIIGQLAPSLGVTGLYAGTRGLFRGGEQGRQIVKQNIDDFAVAGASPSVGQATQKPIPQATESLLSQAPGGSGVMAQVAHETAEKIGNSVQRTADNISFGSNPEIAGRTIQRGISGDDGFIPRFRQKSEVLFDQVDKFIPQGGRVKTDNTQIVLKGLTAQIGDAENISGVLANDKINKLAKAFTEDAIEGTLPYKALKDLRTAVGRQLSSSELVSEAPRAQLKQLYGALSEDMAEAARISGPQAQRAFSRANSFYRSGQQRIDDVLQRISNKVNPEDVFAAATRGREGATTIRAIRRSLKQDEWNPVASSLIKRLGKATPGNQNELGEVFSTETFLTNWNRLAPEAKDALFSGGKLSQYKKDLDAIARVTSNIRDGSKVFQNPSGTAQSGLGLTGTALAVYDTAYGSGSLAMSIITSMVVANGSSRLMASPRFVNWLAHSTSIPLKGAPNHIARLANIAQGEEEEIKEAIIELLDIIRKGNPSE